MTTKEPPHGLALGKNTKAVGMTTNDENAIQVAQDDSAGRGGDGVAQASGNAKNEEEDDDQPSALSVGTPHRPHWTRPGGAGASESPGPVRTARAARWRADP